MHLVGFLSSHVEFYSKNKFEKLQNLVGFIIRIYHDARSPERQIQEYLPAYSRARATITQIAQQLHKQHNSYTNSTTIQNPATEGTTQNTKRDEDIRKRIEGSELQNVEGRGHHSIVGKDST